MLIGTRVWYINSDLADDLERPSRSVGYCKYFCCMEDPVYTFSSHHRCCQ